MLDIQIARLAVVAPSHGHQLRSPDMTLLDFYLWGYLKSVVYEQNLFGRIIKAFARISETPAVFDLVRQSLHRRLNAFIETNGRYLE